MSQRAGMPGRLPESAIGRLAWRLQSPQLARARLSRDPRPVIVAVRTSGSDHLLGLFIGRSSAVRRAEHRLYETARRGAGAVTPPTVGRVSRGGRRVACQCNSVCRGHVCSFVFERLQPDMASLFGPPAVRRQQIDKRVRHHRVGIAVLGRRGAWTLSVVPTGTSSPAVARSGPRRG